MNSSFPGSRSICFLVSSFQSSQFFAPKLSNTSTFLTNLSNDNPARFRAMRVSRSRIISMSQVDVKKHEVFMPALSSTMTEGRIVQWLKQPGDKVEVGEPIMVVESDKADMDVESFEAGYLALIQVEEGESADVGAPVGIIVENKDDISRVSTSSPSPSKAPAASDPPPSTPAASVAPPAKSASAEKPNFAEVFMPALSSTMTDGRVVDWTKSEGDPISVGEIFMVVESDKADMDVESFEDGYIAHILVEAGESCPVGEPVAYVAKTEADIPVVKAWATSSTASASESASTPTASATQTSKAEVQAPPASPPAAPGAAVSESAAVVNEGRIIASPLAKATAKKEGIDLKYVKGTGPNGRIVEADVLKAKESLPVQPYVPQPGKTVATPEAKKIAKKEKIDLATVTGTGNFGRITAEDVLKAAGKSPVTVEKKVPKDVAPQNGASKATIQADSKTTITEMPAGAVAMNAMQKAVVQNMAASLSVPVFRLTYTIKTTGLDELYAKLKPKGVTISALLAKAVAIVLTKHPIMNAAYADGSIVYRPDVNVAMAVALKDGGLITPTLINADKTDLYSLSRNWKDLVNRAMEKKLTPKEYSSGTFVISNLGMFGVDQFDAILPPGVPGILAIGASKPVVAMQENGFVGVHKEMKVTLTADHRHIYGADAAKFLKDLTHLLENDIIELVM